MKLKCSVILGHRWEKEKRIPCGHDIGLQNIKSLHITLGPKVSNMYMVKKKKKVCSFIFRFRVSIWKTTWTWLWFQNWMKMLIPSTMTKIILKKREMKSVRKVGWMGRQPTQKSMRTGALSILLVIAKTANRVTKNKRKKTRTITYLTWKYVPPDGIHFIFYVDIWKFHDSDYLRGKGRRAWDAGEPEWKNASI